MTSRRSLLLLFLLPSLLGCVTQIPYRPNPQQYDAKSDVNHLLLAYLAPRCEANPHLDEDKLVVKAVCTDGDGNTYGFGGVVRFDHVVRIFIEQRNGQYAVKVVHDDGTDDFWWWTGSLEGTERLADALAALSHWELRGRGMVPQ